MQYLFQKKWWQTGSFFNMDLTIAACMWYYKTVGQGSAAKQNMQGYRSGHNEAVLKTVCPQGRVGSNPTPCARKKHLQLQVLFAIFAYRRVIYLRL